ncbi:MAG: hypothetical protein QM675_07325 [Protaetiibacter sp.]
MRATAPSGSFPDALPGTSLQARIAEANTAVGVSVGDLWLSCWSGGDYGKDSALAPDAAYAYAYRLDGNWRDWFDDSVPDPTELFLARVPVASVQDSSSWEFYAGEPGDAEPRWTTDISAKKPVLVDERRQHPSDGAADPSGVTVGAHDLSVISQGGVTYLSRLKRYLYTSWTELSFEFYEAPAP